MYIHAGIQKDVYTRRLHYKKCRTQRQNAVRPNGTVCISSRGQDFLGDSVALLLMNLHRVQVTRERYPSRTVMFAMEAPFHRFGCIPAARNHSLTFHHGKVCSIPSMFKHIFTKQLIFECRCDCRCCCCCCCCFRLATARC
jgi:hypothetical protein